MIALSSNHLWCCIARRATRSLQRLTLFVHVRETEVNQLNVVSVVEKQVFRLKVPMTHPYLVDVLNARDYLLEELAGLLFLESLTLHYVIKQLSATGVLHDEEQLP